MVINVDKKELTKTIEKKLSPRRFRHSLAVAKAAAALAERYGGDKDKAYTAGLLHDIVKDENYSAQLQIIKKSGIILSPVEQASPNLWHAIAGEVYARETVGISDEDILSAIRLHTTGRAEMTLLQKILYVADFTSEDRNYSGVEQIRETAKKDLTAAVLEGLAFCIEDLLAKKALIHEDTLHAYNYYLKLSERNK